MFYNRHKTYPHTEIHKQEFLAKNSLRVLEYFSWKYLPATPSCGHHMSQPADQIFISKAFDKTTRKLLISSAPVFLRNCLIGFNQQLSKEKERQTYPEIAPSSQDPDVHNEGQLASIGCPTSWGSYPASWPPSTSNVSCLSHLI